MFTEKYQNNDLSIISQFNGGIGVEWSIAAGEAVDDIVTTYNNTKSIKMTSTNAANARIDKVVSLNVALKPNIELWYYCDHKENLDGHLKIYLQTKSSWSHLQYIDIIVSSCLGIGWQKIKFNLNEYGCYANTGTPDFTDVTTIRIAFKSKAGTTVNVWLQHLSISSNKLKKGIIILTWDGLWKQFYTLGFPKMKSLGFHGTCFQTISWITSNPNHASYLTLSMLYNLQNSRFDIASHTQNHLDYSAVSLADAINDVYQGYYYLTIRRFKAARLMAWPYGIHPQTVEESITKYCDFARSTDRFMFERAPFSNPYALRCRGFDNTLTLVNAKLFVDNAVSTKAVFILFGHKLGSVADSLTWTTSDFNDLMDYIKTKVDSGLLLVQSLSEYLNCIGQNKQTFYKIT